MSTHRPSLLDRLHNRPDSRGPRRVLALARGLGAAGLLAGLLVGCGGNNHTEYKSFKLSETTLSAPSSTGTVEFKAEWSVSVDDLVNYQMRAYIVPASTTNPTLSDNNRFLDRTCGAPLGNCTDPDTANCTYRRASANSGDRDIACSSGASVRVSPGSYKVIGEECHLDSTLDRKCSTKEVLVELQ